MQASNHADAKTIRIEPALPRGGRWSPAEGKEALDLRRRLATRGDSMKEHEINQVFAEASKILGECPTPTGPERQLTGLVIGYVQSGKTTSFTAVTALARDNKYPIIIVIAGASNPLYDQSGQRLDLDLDFSTRRWHLIPNPKPEVRPKIEATLAEWKDPEVPEHDRQTLIFTVLKHHQRLKDLRETLEKIDLHGVPALVIDDEADQISLNTAARKDENATSTTYRRILELRACLPFHAYLQYTATPQAPLLISLIDSLSPNFGHVLSAGDDYTGGEVFFRTHVDKLVEVIPDNELPTKDSPLLGPPESLQKAMRQFYIGVAAAYTIPLEKRKNRSMLVHPDRTVVSHAEYKTWIQSIQDSWTAILRGDPESTERQHLLNQFREAYDHIASTAIDIPPFETILSYLPRAISKTNVQVVNSSRGKTPEVPWREYSHILIGGQAMDRGYTVRGLTVTYMPRGIGVGNADTIQQRARFFGYKRSYLGYCRVHLDSEAHDAYLSYVEHEEEIHNQLREHEKTGRPLKDWLRRFFLSPDLRPTRDAVLRTLYIRGNYSEKWFHPDAPHRLPPEVRQANREIVAAFRKESPWELAEGDPRRSEFVRHNKATVPLRTAYENLLVPLTFTVPDDSARFAGLRLQIERYLRENPGATCTVYDMSQGRARVRRVDAADNVDNYFQGADKNAAIYPGDEKIRAPEGLTIQIHTLDVHGVADGKRGDLIDANIVAVAVRGADDMSAHWIVQPRDLDHEP